MFEHLGVFQQLPEALPKLWLQCRRSLVQRSFSALDMTSTQPDTNQRSPDLRPPFPRTTTWHDNRIGHSGCQNQVKKHQRCPLPTVSLLETSACSRNSRCFTAFHWCLSRYCRPRTCCADFAVGPLDSLVPIGSDGFLEPSIAQQFTTLHHNQMYPNVI